VTDHSATRTAPIDSDTLIAVEDLRKVFTRRGRTTVALDDVNLAIGRGEFVSLLGPSGCGKSTLLRLLGGLQEPDSGTVSVGGMDTRRARTGKQFGLVPQAPALVPWKTLGQNVRFLTRLHRGAELHPVMNDEQIGMLLHQVGLAGFEHAYPHELSGGMQQRASLVRAFALAAPILLMDEPFGALDEITRADMRYLLLGLWGTGIVQTTVVFVTHSVHEAAILSDRVLVMRPSPGRIAVERTIDLPRPRTPEVEDEAQFHEIVRMLRDDLRQHALR